MKLKGRKEFLMEHVMQKELQGALKVVNASIRKCEKMRYKFHEGTPQSSLLKNRIQSLEIAKSLLENNSEKNAYTIEDLEKALPPVVSIINKTNKAREKFQEGTIQYKRFSPLIDSMCIAKELIEKEISHRKE